MNERIVDEINAPSDVRTLSVREMTQLAEEVRSLIIETTSETGGHVAANLGVVDLTIALMHVFQMPPDKVIWDVSHQTYTHKILTGRRDRFKTLRQYDGLSGFLRRDESDYDVFGAGHSGTAISAALGMAAARDRKGGEEHIIAVIGDGAAGSGISYEALNNVVGATERIIIILNDNEMSIAANVGAMSRYFGRLLVDPRYNRWKRSVESLATRMKMGWLRSGYYRVEEAVKSLFLRSVIFEEFGVRYIGPIDGHSIPALVDSLTVAKDYGRPIILHVVTEKGKGYVPAEKEPEKWHGVPGFDVATGKIRSGGTAPTYSAVFGDALVRLAGKNDRIMAITAAMKAGTGLTPFAQRFPDRFFDVGISEEHAVVFAAGLAVEGFVPVVAIYSTFFQRATDYVIHDVSLQNLPVVFCLDRAGVVGDDGPTHHGVFDIALLRSVPGLTVMQPKDEAELANMLYTATRLGGPSVIRYPRGTGPGVTVPEEPESVEIGKAEIVREGTDAWLWALGDMVTTAMESADVLAEEGIHVGVVNARFVRPLDRDLLRKHCGSARLLVTLENAAVTGGFGSAVGEAMHEMKADARLLSFGWPDEFIPHGDAGRLREQYGLTSASVARAIAGEFQTMGEYRGDRPERAS